MTRVRNCSSAQDCEFGMFEGLFRGTRGKAKNHKQKKRMGRDEGDPEGEAGRLARRSYGVEVLNKRRPDKCLRRALCYYCFCS